jgi:serine/threonine protein kinase
MRAYAVSPLNPSDPARVGQYELRGVLATGAMGRVFLGRSPGGHPVAVKVIHWYLAEDPGFRAQFAQEVTAARKVDGAFTAPVVDADVEGPRPWLATAYVAGPTLAETVTNHGPMPVGSVLALAAGLAEGLGAVHAAGVVHRAFQPGNVLLASDGPRIIDFGISRAVTGASLTASGPMLPGSAAFLSPEQFEEQRIGPSSDIFSLGAVLVYAATGRSPYRAGNELEIAFRVVSGQADLSSVPAPLRPLIERCLAKDPQLRPGTEEILAWVGPQRFGEGWLPAPMTQDLALYDAGPFIRRSVAGHAFMSYVREDAPHVDRLQQILESAGVPVWRDTANLWPGEDWRVKIRRAITDNALVFIACFSQASTSRSRSYQNEELTLAIEQLRLRPASDPWLIPVRLDECEIPDREIGAGRTLTSIQHADLFGTRADEGADRLVAAILRILGQ